MASKNFDQAFYGDDDSDDGEVSDDNSDDDSSELKPVRRTCVADRLRRLRNKSHSVSDPVPTSFQFERFSTIFVSH